MTPLVGAPAFARPKSSSFAPGLQVAMDDPLAVRRIERGRDLPADAKHLVHRQPPLHKAIGERLPLDHLHHEVMRAALVPDVVERADVRMVQRRDRLRLALEPRLELRVRRKVARQNLDRDLALEPRVLRAPDLTHTACADGRDDLVRAEERPGSNFHSGEAP
jgi:hypothetical protein